MSIKLDECPRPDDEDAYFNEVTQSTEGRRIAFWWQKQPGTPDMFKLADKIDDALRIAERRGRVEGYRMGI